MNDLLLRCSYSWAWAQWCAYVPWPVLPRRSCRCGIRAWLEQAVSVLRNSRCRWVSGSGSCVKGFDNYHCDTTKAEASEHEERLTKGIAVSIPSYKQAQAKAKGESDGVQD